MRTVYKAIASLLVAVTLLFCISLPVSAYYEPVTIETVEILDFSYGASLTASTEEYSNAADEEERFGKKLLYSMSNSDNLLKAYDVIKNGIESSSSKVYLSYSGIYITKAELSVVYNIVMCDFPEYFWIGSSVSIASSTYVIYINPQYILSGDELTAAKAQLEEVVSQMTAGLEEKSDYKISKMLHDRICLTTDYVDTDKDQSAYGALIEQEAVCAGYARAYQLLLMNCGIEAWTVTGVSNIPGQDTTVSHAWNIVNLDGNWYYTDITWNDQGNSTDYIFYTYFNVTTEQLNEDHIINESFAAYMPVCDATDNNFFKIKNLEAENYDRSLCVDALKKGGLLARIYVTGDTAAFISEFNADAVNVAKNVGLTGTVSYSINKLGRGLNIVFKGNYTASGDANGDLKTDVKDVLLMRKCLAGLEEETELSLRNADMSSNGTLDIADVLVIRKYLTCYTDY